MKPNLTSAINAYCDSLPFLGFSPNDSLQLCKIAYESYLAGEKVDPDYIRSRLQKNPPTCFSEQALEWFMDGLLSRLNETRMIIEQLDQLERIRKEPESGQP